MTRIRDPLAMRLTLAATVLTNWVRLKPAATTNMAIIMMPLGLPKYPAAVAGSRQPVSTKASILTIATSPMGHLPMI